MAHRTNGKQWNDRELERAPLTQAALDSAMQVVTKLISEYPEAPESDQKKADLQSRLEYVILNKPPACDHPVAQWPVPERYKKKPPQTVGELGQRIDRIAGNLGDDPYMQDMCRAASNAATSAAKEVTAASKEGPEGQAR